MGSAHRTVLFDKRQNVLEGFFSPWKNYLF
jgi:hypothetical protein